MKYIDKSVLNYIVYIYIYILGKTIAKVGHI